MTILLGYQGDDFVVLAADQLASYFSGGRSQRASYRRKILMHPTLPIAVALAGQASFGRGGVMPVQTFVWGVLQRISAEELSLTGVTEALADGLQSRVLDLRADYPPESHELNLARVIALLAVVGSRGAELGAIQCTATCERTTCRPGSWVSVPPPSLVAFYDAFTPERRKPDDPSSPEAVLAHGRALITVGIEEDDRLQLNQVGGGVDGVIVDTHGVHRHDAPVQRLARPTS